MSHSLFPVCRQILTVFSLIVPVSVFGSKKILIYSGAGTNYFCVNQIESTLKRHLTSHYVIKRATKQDLISELSFSKTALVVIPGGLDIPYTEDLNGEANSRIRAFVNEGGTFLGLCAGGYFGGSSVEFAKGTSLQVLGKRELGFFPGKVIGPLFDEFDYTTERGSKAAPISLHPSEETEWFGPIEAGFSFPVYYQGGGYFDRAYDSKLHTQVIADYTGFYPPRAAIVENTVGLGKAILTGVHIEFDPDQLPETDYYLREIIPELKKTNHYRLNLVRSLLRRLNLQLSP